MANYQKTTVGDSPRTELHEKLGLTGAEISVNTMPAGSCVPFVHSHKQNEEIYGILSGSGKAVIDGEEVPLQKGGLAPCLSCRETTVLCGQGYPDFLYLHPDQGALAWRVYRG